MQIMKDGEIRRKRKIKQKQKGPALFHFEDQAGVSHQTLYGQMSPAL